MVDGLGRVKVTDFGVAHFQDSRVQLTQTGLFLGTPNYASPEQATGRSLDVRSDIYGLGAVLYRMLSGKPPITGESPLAVVTKIATEPITPIAQVITGLPTAVCQLIDKMTARKVEDRFQTPEEVVVAIDHCLTSLEASIPLTKVRPSGMSPGPTTPPKPRSRAKFWGGLAGVALAVLLVVWLVEGGFLKQKSTVEKKALENTNAHVVAEKPMDAKPLQPALEKKALDDIKTESVEARLMDATLPKQTMEQKAPEDRTTQVVEEIPMDAKAYHEPDPIAPQKKGNMQTISAMEKAPVVALATQAKEELLPKIPTVLLVVSGDEAMTPLLLTHLESIVLESGLKVASISEIPLLQEKMQFGSIPSTWYVIEPLIPTGKAQMLVLAEIQRAGSTALKYYGRVQEMISATFSVRSLEVDTGRSVAKPVSGSVQFTQLNMEQNIRNAVKAASSGIGPEMKAYWESRIHAKDSQ
jgi:hypothetical protein